MTNRVGQVDLLVIAFVFCLFSSYVIGYCLSIEGRRRGCQVSEIVGEGGHILEEDITDEAVNESGSVLWECFEEFFKAKAGIVKGVDEPVDDIEAFRKRRGEGADFFCGEVLFEQRLVDVIGGQFGGGQCQEESGGINGIEEGGGVADHDPSVPDGGAVSISQGGDIADRAIQGRLVQAILEGVAVFDVVEKDLFVVFIGVKEVVGICDETDTDDVFGEGMYQNQPRLGIMKMVVSPASRPSRRLPFL